eukprot:CAMPEP_0174362322 /NCGR_PEP_ID=MMETSP0811_2-20130205/63816_1 /TAXON_ID=73025 ORGANISM="Eutreptiella gymnastica-like, Strain CCMP1594" /NCGR_SAMPLE_ID=MMETSP0811_2 /ASSEMBLY_ACC=CAM_ASM_000667 /LENGTH=44 /DNA_ID= /DNA_START= /DNA_END= /DNA_ORIENTATION=
MRLVLTGRVRVPDALTFVQTGFCLHVGWCAEDVAMQALSTGRLG